MSDRPEDQTVVVVMSDEIAAKLRAGVTLMAYRTAARSGGRMQLTRAFRATVKGFNREYGTKCQTWDDVKAVMVAVGRWER